MAGDSFGSPACGPARHGRRGMPSAMDGYVEKCTHSSRRIRSRSGAVKGEGGCSTRLLIAPALSQPNHPGVHVQRSRADRTERARLAPAQELGVATTVAFRSSSNGRSAVTFNRLLLGATLAVIVTGPAFAADTKPESGAVMDIIKDGPRPPQDAAHKILQKYGPPQELTATMLVWTSNGAWIRTVVHKAPVEHDF